MRLATPSLRHPLAGALRSRRRATVTPATANCHAPPRALANSRCRAQQRRPIRHRQRHLPSTTPANASPPQAAIQSNPHRPQPLTSPRGFLLRRLSDAGPLTRDTARAGPASETLPDSRPPRVRPRKGRFDSKRSFRVGGSNAGSLPQTGRQPRAIDRRDPPRLVARGSALVVAKVRQGAYPFLRNSSITGVSMKIPQAAAAVIVALGSRVDPAHH
jgi:hypothetical protein